MPAKNIVMYAAGSLGLGSWSRAATRLLEEFPGGLNLLARSGEDLTTDQEVETFLREAASADLVVILLHGGKSSCPFFARLIEAAKQGGTEIYVHPGDDEETLLSREHSTGFGDQVYEDRVQYLLHGGDENRYQFLRAALSLEARPPAPLPSQGLYHPDLGVREDLNSYLEGLGLTETDLTRPTRPVIGIWFPSYLFQEGDLEAMDAIVRAVEDQGAIPVGCFYRRYPHPLIESRDTAWVIENYFKIKDKTIIHCLINPMMFSLSLLRPQEAALLNKLDVPVLQAMPLTSDKEFWETTDQAVNPMDVSMSVAAPEFDGNLIAVPSSVKEDLGQDPLTGAKLVRSVPLPERIGKAAALAINWARLRIKPNSEKKVAIIFHNYPPRNDKIGCGVGLDTFASVFDLLGRLKEEGYGVEHSLADCQELAEAMVAGLSVDQRWLTPADMAARAADRAGAIHHQAWNKELPEKNTRAMAEDWGESPGELFVHEDQVLINGLILGNVYVGIQPPRGFVERPEMIHDPYMSPSWHYLYYYRWIRDVFQADAVMHIAKHGSLEWLPGKSVALGPECYPDLAINTLPNIYPYIVNDPGEGTQAKRRSYCALIDHLIPVMTNAEKYEGLAEVDNLVLQYIQTKATNPTRLPVVRDQIWEAVEQANLQRDLEMEKDQALDNFEEFLEKLHSYLSECADTAISDGLHILGIPPQGDALTELTTQMVRINNGPVPSLRESVARHWGYDYDELLAQRGKADPSGRHPTYATVLEAVHRTCMEIVAATIAGREHPLARENPGIGKVVEFLKETLLPNLARTTDEMEAVVHALNGGFVRPGPTGAPTRGQTDVLPTGRNFYSVDPQKLPTTSAWKVGKALGDDLVERYRRETGSPPDNVGMLIWATSNMRTHGEELAQALYMMGLRPVWNERSGRVEGVEVIPLAELKFPRIDITFRTTGLFRDVFPNLMEMLDQAARMVAALKEPPESNFLRRNVMREAAELEKQGLSPEDAVRKASFRIYSDPPGTYGAGVAAAIDAKAWETAEDLTEVWLSWAGYGYGQGEYGAPMKDELRRRLSDIKLLFKSDDSREYDILGSDDYNAYFGGFFCAVKTTSGSLPRAYIGDASDPERVKNRSLHQEAKHVFRSRILNPKWIEGLMRHGFKGAGDLSRQVDNAFHWDATSKVLEDWMYEGLAEKYAFDPKMREWLKEVNPHALQNIAERLLEAISREMWNTDQETKERLESIYLDIEGDIEDGIG